MCYHLWEEIKVSSFLLRGSRLLKGQRTAEDYKIVKRKLDNTLRFTLCETILLLDLACLHTRGFEHFLEFLALRIEIEAPQGVIGEFRSFDLDSLHHSR